MAGSKRTTRGRSQGTKGSASSSTSSDWKNGPDALTAVVAKAVAHSTNSAPVDQKQLDAYIKQEYGELSTGSVEECQAQFEKAAEQYRTSTYRATVAEQAVKRSVEITRHRMVDARRRLTDAKLTAAGGKVTTAPPTPSDSATAG